jgi:hypothetical protein
LGPIVRVVKLLLSSGAWREATSTFCSIGSISRLLAISWTQMSGCALRKRPMRGALSRRGLVGGDGIEPPTRSV